MWEQWKKSFDSWEQSSAELFDRVLRSPLLLAPSGHLMTAALKAKGAGDRIIHGGWSVLGLPTRRDQERTLHALNEIQSRLHDLEEKLESQRERHTPGEGRR